MKTYLIDANNLIGKIKKLSSIHKKNKSDSRLYLVQLLDRYFAMHKAEVYIHFDGFPNIAIPSSSGRIIYSEKRTADDTIRDQIERTKNPKLLTIISSDHSLQQFAKKCSCEVINSEVFAKNLSSSKDESASEEEIIRNMNNDEFKKLFGG